MSDIKKAVQDKYGAIATSVTERAATASVGCCGPAANCGCDDPITSNLYSDAERDALPETAVQASLGCGNPTALIALEPAFLTEGGLDVDRIAPAVKDTFVSAFIRARKPGAAACCGSDCCQ